MPTNLRVEGVSLVNRGVGLFFGPLDALETLLVELVTHIRVVARLDMVA